MYLFYTKINWKNAILNMSYLGGGCAVVVVVVVVGGWMGGFDRAVSGADDVGLTLKKQFPSCASS